MNEWRQVALVGLSPKDRVPAGVARGSHSAAVAVYGGDPAPPHPGVLCLSG